MIPLKRLYSQPPAAGLASDARFPKPGPSHQDELLQRVFNAEEQAKLTAHLQLSHDRRMGVPTPSGAEMATARMMGPLAGISSNANRAPTDQLFWNRQYGFKGHNGSKVKVNLRGANTTAMR